MLRQLLVLVLGSFLYINKMTAQNTGMLPITGIRYVNEGIWAKGITVKMNGDQLFGNRIPLNQEIEISVEQPTGFLADKQKTIFAAAEYTLVSAKGEVLLKNPNLFLLNEAKGFTAKDAKALSIKFGIAEGLVQPNSKCFVRIRLYDLKGKNQLRLEYPVSISYPREKIYVTKIPQQVKLTPGLAMGLVGLTIKNNIDISIDTLIAINPKRAYLNLEISKIGGTDIINMLQGKETFWVYDTAYNEIKITDILLKKVGGAMEGGNVNCTLKVPFRLKTERPKGYIIRYRWESADKAQIMDIIVTK